MQSICNIIFAVGTTAVVLCIFAHAFHERYLHWAACHLREDIKADLAANGVHQVQVSEFFPQDAHKLFPAPTQEIPSDTPLRSACKVFTLSSLHQDLLLQHSHPSVIGQNAEEVGACECLSLGALLVRT